MSSGEAGGQAGGVTVDLAPDRVDRDPFAVGPDRFRHLADIAQVGLFETDLDGRAVYANAAWCRMTGLTWEQASGHGWLAVLHPDDRDAVAGRWRECASTGVPFRMQCRYRRPCGTDVPVDVQVTQITDGDGAIVAWLGAATDLTGIHALRAEIAATEERFRTIVELSTDVIYRVWTEPFRFDYLSPSVRSLTGRAAHEFYANPLLFTTVLHQDDMPKLVAALDPDQRHPRMRLRLVHAEGRTVTVEAAGSPLLDPSGRKVGIQGALRDITAQVEAETELEHLARRDPLTGLANRRVLFTELAARLEAGRSFTVALIDLDDFKAVNDRHGHVAGDDLLVEVTARLRQAMRADDLIGRLAGDEFLVLSDLADPDPLVRRLDLVFARPFELPGGSSIVASASIGAVRTRAGETAIDAIRRADAAMYAAKATEDGRRWP